VSANILLLTVLGGRVEEGPGPVRCRKYAREAERVGRHRRKICRPAISRPMSSLQRSYSIQPLWPRVLAVLWFVGCVRWRALVAGR
jgi:hypothetical protein